MEGGIPGHYHHHVHCGHHHRDHDHDHHQNPHRDDDDDRDITSLPPRQPSSPWLPQDRCLESSPCVIIFIECVFLRIMQCHYNDIILVPATY